VGDPFPLARLQAIAKEGEERYKKNVPPGYKDIKKEDPTDEMRKYGDLILWMQVIDRAKELNIGVIFVCDDRKEDWWLEFKGRTIGPRPELVAEFKASVDQDFYMYSTDRFLDFAGKFLEAHVSKDSVSEIREIRKDEESTRRRLRREVEKKQLLSFINKCDQSLGEAHVKLGSLEAEASRMRTFVTDLRNQSSHAAAEDGQEISKHLESVSAHLALVEAAIAETQRDLTYGAATREDLAVRLHRLEIDAMEDEKAQDI
jgi:PIN like domain